MIYLVCPFSRPRMARRVWENFARQTYECRLVVVDQTGGTFPRDLPNVTVIAHVPTTKARIADARNEGLYFVREKDGDYLTLDDDDFYGPGYVKEWAANRHRAEVVSKFPHFIRKPDGQICLYCPDKANRLTGDTIHGGAFGVRARDAVDFTENMLSFDREFTMAMYERGAKHYRTGLHNYVYDRFDSDHKSGTPKFLLDEPFGGPYTFEEALQDDHLFLSST
jgi:hypothetical protein